jgi:hypothetical protein
MGQLSLHVHRPPSPVHPERNGAVLVTSSKRVCETVCSTIHATDVHFVSLLQHIPRSQHSNE